MYHHGKQIKQKQNVKFKKQGVEVDIQYKAYVKLNRRKSILYIGNIDNTYAVYILKYA